MIIENDRTALRQTFHLSWQKYKAQQILSPLEQQIVAVIQMHDEYHALMDDVDAWQREYVDGNAINPYLHMSLHLSVRDQINTDRPRGIKNIFTKLCEKMQDIHQAEHCLMDKLAFCLWEAQRNGIAPDEQHYLQSLSYLSL